MNPSKLSSLEFQVLPARYAVTRLDPAAPDPGWLPPEGLTCVVRTPQELSVVCRESGVPGSLQSEGGWRCLGIIGTLDFSLVGILAAVSSALAEEGISLFAISTFDTDYFLVSEADLGRTVKALAARGARVLPGGIGQSG